MQKIPWLASCCVVVAVLTQTTTAQRRQCDSACVKLQECPELAKLLRNPTREGVKKLQEATCGFSGTIPLVCCPPPPVPTLSLLPTNCGHSTKTRVVGGNLTKIGDYPWMAVFGYKDVGFDTVEYACAGSIINERYILTAAHCVAPDLLAYKKLEVIGLGDWDLRTDVDCQTTLAGDRYCADPSLNVTYEEIIIHPTYNKRALHSDDIALIRLSEKVDLTGTWIHPICLPPQGLKARSVMSIGEGIVTGWGTTENGTNSDKLLEVAVPYIEKSACNSTYKGHIIDEQICMGGVAGQDSCAGDSGGPLIIGGRNGPPYLQIGVVSYGPTRCGQNDIPGVYTDVTFYRDWIEETIRP